MYVFNVRHYLGFFIMVVKELTISFYPKFPSIFFKIWLFHNFWPITSKNLHYMTVLSLHRSNDILWLYFLSYATGFPLEFVIFFICLLVFYVNLCLIFFTGYLKSVIWLSLFPIAQTHLLVPSPLPLFLMEIFSWTVSFF